MTKVQVVDHYGFQEGADSAKSINDAFRSLRIITRRTWLSAHVVLRWIALVGTCFALQHKMVLECAKMR